MKTQKNFVIWTWVLFIIALFAFALVVSPVQAGPGSGPKSLKENAKGSIKILGKIWGKHQLGQPRQAVKGCSISVYDGRYNLIKTIKTEQDGRYDLHLQPNKDYVIIIKKTGFLTRRIKITTLDDQFVPAVEELNITLTPEGYNDPFASRR
jgi:hypothetical protein